MGYRRAGKSTYELAEKRRKKGLQGGLIILGLAIFALFFFSNRSLFIPLGGGFLVIMLILLIVLPDFAESFLRKNGREEKRAIRGADAEVEVGSILDSLEPDDFLVYHDIRSPYGNIDHIVIKDTGGVFLIETKSHGGKVCIKDGKVFVNNKFPEKDFIKQILNNTYWLKNRIETKSNQNAWVVPILVFTNAFVEHSYPVQRVNILNKKYLGEFLKNDDSSSPGGLQMWERWKKSNPTIN